MKFGTITYSSRNAINELELDIPSIKNLQLQPESLMFAYTVNGGNSNCIRINND